MLSPIISGSRDAGELAVLDIDAADNEGESQELRLPFGVLRGLGWSLWSEEAEQPRPATSKYRSPASVHHSH
jgi:hypothetical protein